MRRDFVILILVIRTVNITSKRIILPYSIKASHWYPYCDNLKWDGDIRCRPSTVLHIEIKMRGSNYLQVTRGHPGRIVRNKIIQTMVRACFPAPLNDSSIIETKNPQSIAWRLNFDICKNWKTFQPSYIEKNSVKTWLISVPLILIQWPISNSQTVCERSLASIE